MIWLYVINTCFAVGIVLAVLFPRQTQRLLRMLGLWNLVSSVDTIRFQKIMQSLAIFLMVAAVALFASILAGGHPLDWALPASEGLFFGLALVVLAHWSGKKPPDDQS